MEDLLTVKQAAERKKVHRSAIYRAIAEKRLRSSEVLGRMVIHRADLADYVPCYDPPYARGKR